MTFKEESSINETTLPKGSVAGWRQWRRLWRGWIVVPTGIGVSVFTVFQWRRSNYWNNPQENPNSSKNFQITCYRAIPLRAMSRAWGWLSSRYVPLSIRCWLYSQYANMYGVNLDEAAYSLEYYSSLCEFFIRPLKQGTRPVAELEPIVSPADGSIINVGVVNSCNVEQIKGVTYTIKTFLGEPAWNIEGAIESGGGNEKLTMMMKMGEEKEEDNEKAVTTNASASTFSNSRTDSISRCDEILRNSRPKYYWKHHNADDTMENMLKNKGCELLQLGLDSGFSCGAKFRLNSHVIGWLLFYLQFCLKDLLINSFYIGFQIMYGIKSSIVLSNGKILKGASFLRSRFSFSRGNGSSSPVFEAEIDAATSGQLSSEETGSGNSDDGHEDTCHDPDWKEYKKKLLRNADNELYQLIVYLAPGDYHRFHSPANLKIKFRRHFQGELLSVHPKIAKWIPELFSLNERAVYVGDWEHGFFSVTAVGATNVGSIKVHSDKELLTNTRRWKDGPRFKDKYLETEWKKGEEIGEFRLGSTIVLLFEAPKHFRFGVRPGQRIKVGEPVTQLRVECIDATS